MADQFNWDDLSTQYGNKYKDYAPDGVYKVKIGSVENRKSSTGTFWMEFKPEDSEQYAFPKISHPLSAKNKNWRAWHWKELFVLLGASDEGAKKNVEACEGKADFAHIQAAYLSAMERLVAKKPEVDIEVWKDGKYSRADFNNGVRMNRPDDEKEATSATDILGSEEISIDAGDIPF